MKQLLIYLLLNLFILRSAVNQTVTAHGQLSVKGKFLTDQHNQVVVLQGVCYGWTNWWPRFYTKESVKWLAEDWNCTVVRAAMGVGMGNSYLDRPEWSKELLETVVRGAIEKDIYVIIDWHSYDLHLEEAKAIFAMLYAPMAITRSLTATSRKLPLKMRLRAMAVSHAATMNPPRAGRMRTIIPAMISITPTTIINACGETGSSRVIAGCRYFSQWVSKSVNLSSPATIGTSP
jgi:hypothetical protein